MLKLSRKSEYALMALQYLSVQPDGRRVAVPTLAEERDLPKDLLAKVMQHLKRAGLVRSVQGVSGGYELARPLAQITFLEAIGPFEEALGLVQCVDAQSDGCERSDCCALHDPMEALNRWLMSQLATLTLAEFIAAKPPTAAGCVRQPRAATTLERRPLPCDAGAV